jgi:hypothetical protein
MSARTLITGIAALLLATGAAHATDQLPEYMLGRWCYGNDVSTEAQIVYFRPDIRTPDSRTCSDLTDGIIIDQEGYDDESVAEDASTCSFDKIERKEENTYLVHVHCKAAHGKGKPSFEGQEEFQLVNGLLFKKRMPEG